MREQEMKKKDGFKETKLGWIPEEWEVKKISEIGKVITGGTPSTSVGEYWGNEHLWYTPTDISNFSKYAGFSKRTISSFGLKKSSATLFPKGTLMVCTRATIGEIAIATSESCTNQGFKNLIVNEKNELEFIYYLLIYSKKRLIRLSSGSTFLELGTNDFREVGLFTPKLPEQKAIANCLSTWDTAITKQDALIKEKKQLKKALMQQLLSGKKRLSGFSGEWATNRFDYFLNYSPRPLEKPKKAFTKLGIRSHCKGTFQNKNFKSSAIAIDTMYLVKPNDLIVNITFAWEGAVAIVKQEDEGALVSHRFPTYEFIDGISDVGFFKQFVQSKWFRYQLDLISPGGAGRNRVLSKKELNKLKIRLPDYKEQNAIAEVLKTADQEITLLTNQRNQLQLQKKGLMQQLLTGEKRLKV
jgi:type I restriction enzyme S subunit